MQPLKATIRVSVAIVTALSGSWSASSAAPEQPYGQKLVYDSGTGQWVEPVPPEPGTEDGDLQIARDLLARKELKKAKRALGRWMALYGYDSTRHPEALFLLGRVEFELGNYIKAHERYQEIIGEYPGTEFADRALRADFVIAEMFLAGKKRKVWKIFRFKAVDEGLDILDDIIVNNPNSPLAEQAIKTKADYYFRTGQFDLAEDEYAHLAREYPRGQYERQALLLSARSALASFPGIHFDDAPLIEAAERFRQFRQKYPGYADSEGVGQVLEQIRNTRAHKEYEIGRHYERTRHYDAAAFYYRSVMNHWPETMWAGMAESRLFDLGYLQPAEAVDETTGWPPEPSAEEAAP